MALLGKRLAVGKNGGDYLGFPLSDDAFNGPSSALTHVSLNTKHNLDSGHSSSLYLIKHFTTRQFTVVPS